MLDAMKAELARSMEHFKSQKMPPYFLSYEVTETESANVNGSAGPPCGGACWASICEWEVTN